MIPYEKRNMYEATRFITYLQICIYAHLLPLWGIHMWKMCWLRKFLSGILFQLGHLRSWNIVLK